jgi:hypothetical protein
MYPRSRSRLRTNHAAPTTMCSRLNHNIACAILQAKSKTKRGSLLGFTFEDVDPEAATRYKFDPKKHDFVQDTVKIKMQNETMVTDLPGATRVLFRCKVPPNPSLQAAGDSCSDYDVRSFPSSGEPTITWQRRIASRCLKRRGRSTSSIARCRSWQRPSPRSSTSSSHLTGFSSFPATVATRSILGANESITLVVA